MAYIVAYYNMELPTARQRNSWTDFHLIDLPYRIAIWHIWSLYAQVDEMLSV